MVHDLKRLLEQLAEGALETRREDSVEVFREWRLWARWDQFGHNPLRS